MALPRRLRKGGAQRNIRAQGMGQGRGLATTRPPAPGPGQKLGPDRMKARPLEQRPGRRVGQYRRAGLTPPPPPGQVKKQIPPNATVDASSLPAQGRIAKKRELMQAVPQRKRPMGRGYQMLGSRRRRGRFGRGRGRGNAPLAGLIR
jgi:hypothetical protein